jgi:hypothetical protein
MGKKKTKAKAKKPVVRQPTKKSNVDLVNNSEVAKQSGAKMPPVPAIGIKKVADFAFGSIGDIPAHLASHVTWTGEGTLQYAPPLAEVGPPRDVPYRIAVTVDGVKVPPKPAELSFRITRLDPELTVDMLADFEIGSISDIPGTIEKLVHHKSTGKEVYTPELDTIGAAGDYTIAIQVPAHENYKQSKKQTLSFSILKRTPSFKIQNLADLEFGDARMVLKMQKAVKIAAGGPPVYEPPLDSIQDPGVYAINVYLEETDEYAESGYETLNVTILPTSHFKSTVFEAWEKANKDVINQSGFPSKQFQRTKVDIQQDRTGAYETRAAINDALNQVIGVPNRATVWTELGYALKGSEWDMPAKWTTTKGTQFHLTISANSIIVPKSKADWAASAATLFDKLFLSPPITERVHLTLEEATSKSPSSHLFLGDVTGGNKAVADTWWRNQAGEMKPKLADFKANMIQKIADIKAKYKL